jgi:glycosyltransferase involved in cell wall biosynthesis
VSPPFRRRLAIVPAYNEKASIALVIDEIRQHAPEFDVLVVDDGSTDATGEIARRMGVLVITLPFNLGIGGCMQTGFTYALEHGYDAAVQVDGDGQHDPREIRALLEALERQPELDIAIGSRFLESASKAYRSTRPRLIGIALFSNLLSLIVGQRITDPTSGFRIYNRQAIELFARNYPHDYPEVEAMLLLHAARLRSVEIPVQMRARTGGRSSIDRADSVYYMVKVLLAILVGLLRGRRGVVAGDDAPVSAETTI